MQQMQPVSLSWSQHSVCDIVDDIISEIKVDEITTILTKNCLITPLNNLTWGIYMSSGLEKVERKSLVSIFPFYSISYIFTCFAFTSDWNSLFIWCNQKPAACTKPDLFLLCVFQCRRCSFLDTREFIHFVSKY